VRGIFAREERRVYLHHLNTESHHMAPTKYQVDEADTGTIVRQSIMS
jgi:hypothetical protein